MRQLGYHCLDVYIPWNHHEVGPGVWDFDGERDIKHFLELAHEEGLLVLARPGPYICSEWDGGGLPAWLGTVPGLRVRQAEAQYLAHVDEWYARVLPMLAELQVTRGGPVALVQLENELDFFDCDDPHAYVTALRDMAGRHGIDVPLIACAGQGDGARASGMVDGVAPAFNLYPSDESADVEAQTAHVEAAARAMGLPLLVTETNRLHRTLRRIAGSGARLLGPYLQASGWNAGYRSVAVNNWGSPLALMTHDYDFGGALAPDGTERADAGEGKALAALIDALGPRLGAAVPAGVAADVECGPDTQHVTLALDGGGELITMTNLGDEDASIVLGTAHGPVGGTVPAGSTRMLVRGLPLGETRTLVLATAELGELRIEDDAVHIGFQVDLPATVVLELGDVEVVEHDGDLAIGQTDAVIIHGTGGRVRLATPEGELVLSFDPRPVAVRARRALITTVDRVRLSADDPTAAGWRDTGVPPAPAERLEGIGSYEGAVRYRATADLTGARGLVLGGPADLVVIRAAGYPRGWFACGGTDVWVPASEPWPGALDEIVVETRVWGHSNFDDGRLPSLRLGATRGMTGALVVTGSQSLGEGWRIVQEGSTPRVGGEPSPRIGWSGWMSAQFPQTIRLVRRLDLPGGADGAALVLDSPGGHHEVTLDGRPVGVLTPLRPVLLLGRIDRTADLAVTSTRAWGEPAGELHLYTGSTLDRWATDVVGERDVVDAARRSLAGADDGALPIEVEPGRPCWLEIDLGDDDGHDTVLRASGSGLLLTFVLEERVHGRMWTEAPPGAELKGGRGDVVVVPAGVMGTLAVLLEATGEGSGRLDELRLGGSIDL